MKMIRNIANLSCVLAATLIVHTASAQMTTESTTSTTTTAGTVTQTSPDTLMVNADGSTTPVSYSYTKTTTYVDEMGNPVSVQTVKSGLPVTVYYTKTGDKMVATKVVVRKATVVTPVVPVDPVVEKKTSTTTTTVQ